MIKGKAREEKEMIEYLFFHSLKTAYLKLNTKVMKRRFLKDIGVDTSKHFRKMRDL